MGSARDHEGFVASFEGLYQSQLAAEGDYHHQISAGGRVRLLVRVESYGENWGFGQLCC